VLYPTNRRSDEYVKDRMGKTRYTLEEGRIPRRWRDLDSEENGVMGQSRKEAPLITASCVGVFRIVSLLHSS
jgi:hypothetical protein